MSGLLSKSRIVAGEATGSTVGAFSGSQSVKVEPRPTSLSTVMSPPRSRAMRRLIARPTPAPCCAAGSRRVNSSKIVSCLATGIPGPVSLTLARKLWPVRSTAT